MELFQFPTGFSHNLNQHHACQGHKNFQFPTGFSHRIDVTAGSPSAWADFQFPTGFSLTARHKATDFYTTFNSLPDSH